MATRDGIETEVKFRIGDAGEMNRKLEALGAKLVRSGRESNIKYDRDGELSRKKELLRLRSYAGECDITHKRKPANTPSDLKVRVETIVHVGSFDAARKLLEALGYRKAWVYEKDRHIWELSGVEVMVDVLPLIGNFVEIEGTREEIEKTASSLGLSMKHASVTTYSQEYEAYRRENNLPFQDLVFPED